MRKHYSKLLLALGMAGVMSVNVFAAVTFKDVPNTHWAYPAVSYMQEKGYMTRNSSGEFLPASEVTYFELAEVLAKATGYQDEAVVKDMDPTLKQQIAKNYEVQKPVLKTYMDKYKAWETRCNEEIAYLIGRGYLKKDELSKFMTKTADGKEVKNIVTKQDLAALLVRVIGKEKTAQESYTGKTPFTDHNLIKEENRPAVAYLNKNGLLNGDDKGNMGANTKVTRALCAQMTYSALQFKEKLEPPTKPSTPNDTVKPTGEVTLEGRVDKVIEKDLATGSKYVVLEINGDTKFYTATKETQVVDRDNRPLSLAAVTENAKVKAIMTQKDGAEVLAKIQILSPVEQAKPEATTYKGTIENIGRSGSISVLTSGKTVTYKVEQDCKIVYQGETLAFEDLRVGDTVQIEVKDLGVTHIKVLQREEAVQEKVEVEFLKSVRKPEGYKVTIREQNKEKEVFVSEDAKVTRNGKSVELSDLRIGDQLTMQMEGREIVAIEATATTESFIGTVDSIVLSQNPQLVVLSKGEKKTVNITNNTELYDASQRVDTVLREIQLGSKVEVLTESKEAISVVIKDAPSQITYKGIVENVGQGAKYIDVLVEYDAMTGETMTVKRINVPSQVEIIVDDEKGYRNQIKEDMEVLITFNYGEEMYPESIEVIR